MWREVDHIPVDAGDEFPIHHCGSGTAESVIGGDGEQERAAGVLDVDDEAGDRVIDGVRRIHVRLAAVQRDISVIERKLYASRTGVRSADAEAIDCSCRVADIEHLAELANETGWFRRRGWCRLRGKLADSAALHAG